MRKFILPLMLVAALAAPSLAMAAASTAEGTIKSLDVKAWTLVLNDGTSYTLAKTIKVADLKVGEKVKITWSKMGTVNEASAIVAE